MDVIFTVLIIVSKKHNQLSNCTEVVATALGSRVNWVSWASLTDKVPFKFWHWRQLRKHLFGKVFVCPYNWVKCWFKCPNKIWAVNGTLVQSVGYGRHGLVLIANKLSVWLSQLCESQLARVSLRGSAWTKGCYSASEPDRFQPCYSLIFQLIIVAVSESWKVPGGARKLYNN